MSGFSEISQNALLLYFGTPLSQTGGVDRIERPNGPNLGIKLWALGKEVEELGLPLDNMN